MVPWWCSRGGGLLLCVCVCALRVPKNHGLAESTAAQNKLFPLLPAPLHDPLAAGIWLQIYHHYNKHTHTHNHTHTHTHMHTPVSLTHISAGSQRNGGECTGVMVMRLPLGFLFFLRLLPQRHCSICVPLLKMFQRNHIDLGEEQSSGLNTQI